MSPELIFPAIGACKSGRRLMLPILQSSQTAIKIEHFTLHELCFPNDLRRGSDQGCAKGLNTGRKGRRNRHSCTPYLGHLLLHLAVHRQPWLRRLFAPHGLADHWPHVGLTHVFPAQKGSMLLSDRMVAVRLWKRAAKCDGARYGTCRSR